MKQFLAISISIFCLLSVYGQKDISYFAKSNIFTISKEENGEYINEFILLRSFQKDTIIKGKTYKKYNTEKFKNIRSEKEKSSYYESFENNQYIKLDKNLDTIHSINLKEKTQKGVLFGKAKAIDFEYIDERSYSPKEKLIPDNYTPKKFYEAGAPKNYLVIRPSINVVEIQAQNNFYLKHLLGIFFSEISESLKNEKPINNQYKNRVGDEVQLVYKKASFDEKTGNIKHKNKQLIDLKIIKDTIINNQRVITLNQSEYNFHLKRRGQIRNWEVIITDDSYILDGFKIPIKDYVNDLKIENNKVFIQGIVKDKICNKRFPLIKKYESRAYFVTQNILPFFPIVFYNMGDVEGCISYARLDGIEYGTKEKIENEKPKDKTNLWLIKQASEDSFEVSFYVAKKSKIGISFWEGDNEKMLFDKELDKGEYREVIHTSKLIPNEYYRVDFIYEEDGTSGIEVTGFYTN